MNQSEYDSEGRTDRKQEKEAYTFYRYDKNNQIATEGIKNLRPAAPGDQINETRSYTYDDLGRLKKSVTQDAVKNSSTTKTYTYDKNGNQITEPDSITSQQNMMSYDADNRLTGYTATQNG